MRVVDERERLWIMVSRGDISAKYLIKNQPNATSKISQTPHLADKKTPIYLFFRILPQAHTSELTA
jgi:hypothetical protein